MQSLSLALTSAARVAREREIARFTRFLDPAQAAQAREIARQEGAALTCWGGFAEAERVIACFHPLGDAVDHTAFPLVCLHSRVNTRFAALSHRDLLGAFMALGLTRDCVGDIILEDTGVYLFAEEKLAPHIAQSLTSAGRVPLRLAPLAGAVPDFAPKGTTFGAVVSALRLDAVAAAAYRLSRGEAAELVRAGLVKVDHLPCDRVDRVLAEGALLSIRGKGRVRLLRIDGTTRKQRIGITLFRYE